MLKSAFKGCVRAALDLGVCQYAVRHSYDLIAMFPEDVQVLSVRPLKALVHLLTSS